MKNIKSESEYSDVDFLVRYFIGNYVYNHQDFECNGDVDVFKLILGSTCFDYINSLR